MAFLQTIFLAGLAAAAIPVLIHLLNRPQAKVVRFSTLEFVKRLQIRRSKRLRIREFLLLLLRMLIIALLAVAFARPALQGDLARGLGGRVRTSACIILDASYSMAYEEGGESLFDRAKARGREVVDLLRDGDESSLILASRAPELRFEQPTHNFRLLETEIEKAGRTSRGTDIPLALREAGKVLRESRNPNREIYLVSDLQRSGLRLDSGDWESLVEDDLRLFLLPVGKEKRSNVAVTAAELYEPRRFGETVRIRGTVTNYSDRRRELLATLILDGERRGTASLALEPGRSEATIFSLNLDEGGSHLGEIRIDDDELADDNSFYFTLDRPDRLKVLIVGGENSEDVFYLSSALDPEGGDGLMEVETIDPGELRSARLEMYHAIFLLDVPTLAGADIDRLEVYQKGGGGIVIVPGDGIDTGAYNQAILPRLFGGTRFGESLLEQRNRPVGLEWFEPDHPAFALFPRGVKRALEELQIVRHFDLLAGENETEVARTGDGRPFLLEVRRGAGRAFLFSVGFDLKWSDLTTEPVFLPMVHEIVRYLYAGGALYHRTITVGRPYRRDLSNIAIGEEFLCTTPAGEEVVLQPRTEGDRLVLEFDGTDVPGFYHIHGRNHSEWFAVNLETEESDLSAVEDSELLDQIALPGAVIVPDGERLEREVLGSRFGRELWWELLAIALLLAIVELAVAQGTRRTVVTGT